ncbi:MAG: exo-alpha-sialidase, partial [Hyphomicrobiaceae bacterium]
MVCRRTITGFGQAQIVGDAECPHWNPVLAAGPDGRTWLFFRRGTSIDTWTTWVCRSGDQGLTWDEPTPLVSG